VPGAAYKKGDVIGQKYEVYGVLGRGGFGIVYLVYSRELGVALALKTFRDECLADAQTRERFRKEASIWVDLERHPYLVQATFVEESAGRLFIALEHIAPDENGLNTLEGHLRQRPPDLTQSLRWAIQFCYGMEYACLKGVRCHRDIKPANIMIGQDKAVKITDFGLAGVLGPAQALSGVRLNIRQGVVGLSGQTIEGTGFGTPTHMPPEQFTDAVSCDERSDIYSFGVVLFEMASNGWLPFQVKLPTGVTESETARFWAEMHRLHATAPVPKLDSLLFPVIRRCMEKEPAKRYQSFKEVRGDLEPLLKCQTGETVRPPESMTLGAWEWVNKGVSLVMLSRHEEAIRCLDRALEIDPRSSLAWHNKGAALHSQGLDGEAIVCLDRALEISPCNAYAWIGRGDSLCGLARNEEAVRSFDRSLELEPRDARAWNGKGLALSGLGRDAEAIGCHDRALEIDPSYALAWKSKGNSLYSLGRDEDALRCLERALGLDPLDALAWFSKGACHRGLNRHEEAVYCFDRTLKLAPQNARAWHSKGLSLGSLGRHEEAIRCYDKTLELEPQYAAAWTDKALGLSLLGREEEADRCFDTAARLAESATQHSRQQLEEDRVTRPSETKEEAQKWIQKGMGLLHQWRDEEAIHCFDRALEIDQSLVLAWLNKGLAHHDLGRSEEAVSCYGRALGMEPQNATALYNRARAQEQLGLTRDAVQSYRQFIALAPAGFDEETEYAQQRIHELEGS